MLDSPDIPNFFSAELIRRGERLSGDQPGVLMSREPTDDDASVRVPALLSIWQMLSGCCGDVGDGEP